MGDCEERHSYFTLSEPLSLSGLLIRVWMTQTQLYCAKPTPVLVLSFGFCWCDKHHDQKQFGEENIYFSLELIVHRHCEGKSGQELSVGTLFTGLLSMDYSVCFFYVEVAPPTVG